MTQQHTSIQNYYRNSSKTYRSSHLYRKITKHPQSAAFLRDKSKQKTYNNKQNNKYDQLLIENNELASKVKFQQTRLMNFKEQQKRLIKQQKYQNNNLLIKKNIQLKQNVENLNKQLHKIKRSLKYTNMKQLAIQNQVSLQIIADLKSKLISYQLGQNHAEQKYESIILAQQQHRLQIINLQNEILQYKHEIEKQYRQIKQLTISVNSKSKQIKLLKQKIDKMKTDDIRARSMIKNFVPKTQVIQKREEVLYLLEKNQKMENIIFQFQAKLKVIKSQQIEKINMQALKRKQLVSQYELLKQKYQSLQQMFTLLNERDGVYQQNISFINNRSQVPMPSIMATKKKFEKKKNPLVVSIQHIENTTEDVIYTLQLKNIPCNDAIEIIIAQNDEISLKQFFYILQRQPFCVYNAQQRILFARYVIELNQEQIPSMYINYDQTISCKIIKSILKKLFDNYHLFEDQDFTNFPNEIYKYYDSYAFNLREILVNGEQRSKAKHQFQGKVINLAIKKHGILDQKICQFIVHKTHHIRHQKITLDGFFQFIYRKQEQNSQQSINIR